ncbi:hypothetical protein HanLR1_Chr14g0511791 [Helianthus annuus]|nr:hypothetical protein HanLR1_Chr14g0511791 [Helianthus annuus]
MLTYKAEKKEKGSTKYNRARLIRKVLCFWTSIDRTNLAFKITTKKESIESNPSDFCPTVLSPTRKSRRVRPHPKQV